MIIQRNDFICVRWGEKPNLSSGSSIPSWGAPALCIELPSTDIVTLEWNGTLWTDGDYTLEYTDDWCLTGPAAFEHCFEIGECDNPLCRPFPEGYSFYSRTGPSIYYEIIEFNHEVDDAGRYHHTAIEAEQKDTNSGLIG